jgi:hypothetical protein
MNQALDDRTGLLRNLVFCNPMTATSGFRNAADGRPSVRTGTVPTFASSRHGYVANFGGAGVLQHVKVFDLLGNNKSHSVSFWFQADASATTWFFAGAQNGGGAGFTLDYGIFTPGHLGWLKSGVVFRSFAWTKDSVPHHFVASANDSTVELYLDGVLQLSAANTGGISLDPCPEWTLGGRCLGAFPTTNFDNAYTGKMWSFCMWNRRALTQAEVTTAYRDPFFYLAKNDTQYALATQATAASGGGGGEEGEAGYTAGTGSGVPWTWWD